MTDLEIKTVQIKIKQFLAEPLCRKWLEDNSFANKPMPVEPNAMMRAEGARSLYLTFRTMAETKPDDLVEYYKKRGKLT